MLQVTYTTAQPGPAACSAVSFLPTHTRRMTLPRSSAPHALESTHVAPDSLPGESGLNFLLWLSEPPSHTALCLSNPFSPCCLNRLSSLLPHPVTHLG